MYLCSTFAVVRIYFEEIYKIGPPGGIAQGLARWRDTYTKVYPLFSYGIMLIDAQLWVWGLESYAKIAYLDADTLILSEMDELFNYPEVREKLNYIDPYISINYYMKLGAVKDGPGFIASLFILEPSTKKLQNMLNAMKVCIFVKIDNVSNTHIAVSKML